MKRRDFITLLGGAVALPMPGRAQQGGKVARVGVLTGLSKDDPSMQVRLAEFRLYLGKFGWLDGSNVRIEYRFAPGGEGREEAVAKELVEMNPDVILAHTTPITTALQRQSRTIPIVFTSVSDPIGSGFIMSLARPGANLTGFILYEEGIVGKWFAMLKEIAPGLAQAALLGNPKTAPYDYFLRSAMSTARSLSIEVISSPVADAGDIERSIDSIARVPNSGLIFPPDATTSLHRDLILALTARFRLPAVYAFRYFVTAGGLMSYSADLAEPFRQAATYVDRILRGANPADLPVQAPTKYETVLNLKTAKALGLEVPPSLFELVINLRSAKGLGLTVPAKLLAIADEVIE